MTRWKRILLPVDFSPCSRAALSLAGDLAVASGATVILHHATERPAGLARGARLHLPRGDVDADAWADQQTRERLDPLALELRARGVSVELRAVVGKPAARILSAIVDDDADLVVLGTHGRTGLAHALLGSVAETVVRHASVPVITVRSPCGALAGVDDDEVEHQLDAETQG